MLKDYQIKIAQELTWVVLITIAYFVLTSPPPTEVDTWGELWDWAQALLLGAVRMGVVTAFKLLLPLVQQVQSRLPQ